MACERLERTALARPQTIGELRRELAGYAEEAGASDAAREAVALAVSEALTNAVVHAYRDREPGPIIVEAWTDGDGHLLVVVCDEGSGMVPRTDSAGLGVGLSVMAQMADDVRVATLQDTSGTRVSLRFSLDGSAVTLPDKDVAS
jgi:serine/threonine-protein kinase RsbW